MQELKQSLKIKDSQIKDLEEEVVNLSGQKEKSSCRVTDGELNYSKVHLCNKLTSFKESVAAGSQDNKYVPLFVTGGHFKRYEFNYVYWSFKTNLFMLCTC